ncbi:CtsR family transcriptional regulator [Lactobacillus sp. S2-2]|nr:CtsR family transcriptional regulator [Lactobacillus sp. S2-2]
MEGKNASEVIENYLKSLFENDDCEWIEICRSDVADLFDVVPSQINYVIKTRFSIQNGYLVKSKRGGGGYIKIEKVNIVDNFSFLDDLIQYVGNSISQQESFKILQTLFNNQLITNREKTLLSVSLDKRIFSKEPIDENKIRAKILISIIERLKYEC